MPRELPAGTEITCPECSQIMLIAKTVIVGGSTRIGPEAFHQVGFLGARGDRAICPYDGTPFVRQRPHETDKARQNPDDLPEAQIHTRDGWR